MRLNCLVNPRVLIVLAIACFAPLVLSAQASGVEQAPLWGPNAADPTVKVINEDYQAPPHSDEYCYDGDFIVHGVWHPIGYYSGYFGDQVRQLCSMSTDFGSVSTGDGDVMSINGQAYHFYDRMNILQVPHASSLFVGGQGGGLEAYDDPASTFYVGSGVDYFYGGKYHKMYRLVNGAKPRVLKDSTGRRVNGIDRVKASRNGKWLLAQRDRYVIRVKADDFSNMLSFKAGVSAWTWYSTPDDDLAISNDGRYAATGGGRGANFNIFDLSTCTPEGSRSLKAAEDCGRVDMVDFLETQLGGRVLKVDQLRFSSNGQRLFLHVAVRYPSGDAKNLLVSLSTSAAKPLTNYIALGDSFASGEGTFDYFTGTDEDDNKCHLSPKSYPFLLQTELHLDMTHSVACSGARIININGSDGDEQHPVKPINNSLGEWLPGYKLQLDFIKSDNPNIVTVSIGGNDIGFKHIVSDCVFLGTCYDSYEDRLGLVKNINSKFDDLVKLYSRIKHDMPPTGKVYVIGYPQIVNPDGDNCTLNVRLNTKERLFASNLVSYLDFVIGQAAKKAGVQYVDVEGALSGHNLCGKQYSQEPAVNGLTIGDDGISDLSILKYFKILGRESYHPTKLGHRLLASAIASKTNDFQKPMPTRDNSIERPGIEHATALLANTYKSGDIVRQIEFAGGDRVKVILSRGVINGSLQGYDYSLQARRDYTVWLHSTPMELGTVRTDNNGNLTYSFKLPPGIETGFHTVDIRGVDKNGQPISIRRTIYVTKSYQDLDGDGVPNNQEPCGILQPSGVDYDEDGIDDSCDGIISQPKSRKLSVNPQIHGAELAEPTGTLNQGANWPNNTTNLIKGPVTYNPQTIDSKKVLGAQNESAPINKTADVTEAARDNSAKRFMQIVALVVGGGCVFLTYVAIIRYAKKH